VAFSFRLLTMSSRARFNAVINWVERPCSSHPWMDSPRWFQGDVQSQHQSAERGVSCGLPPWGVQSHVGRRTWDAVAAFGQQAAITTASAQNTRSHSEDLVCILRSGFQCRRCLRVGPPFQPPSIPRAHITRRDDAEPTMAIQHRSKMKINCQR